VLFRSVTLWGCTDWNSNIVRMHRLKE